MDDISKTINTQIYKKNERKNIYFNKQNEKKIQFTRTIQNETFYLEKVKIKKFEEQIEGIRYRKREWAVCIEMFWCWRLVVNASKTTELLTCVQLTMSLRFFPLPACKLNNNQTKCCDLPPILVEMHNRKHLSILLLFQLLGIKIKPYILLFFSISTKL